MKRILLLQPPLEDFYTTPIRLYPLGLSYAAGIMEDAGNQVRILDCLAPPKKSRRPLPSGFSYLEPYLRDPLFFRGYFRFGLSEPEILSRSAAFEPDWIGISSQFTAYYQSVHELAARLKERLSVPIFIGGNHATAFPEEILKRTPAVDFVLSGPAEDCLPDFLASRGMAGEGAGKVDWKRIRPAHHLLEPGAYRMGKRNYISLGASRGCPFACEFCSVHRMFGKSIVYRAAGAVIEEMRWSYVHKEARIFNFEDDNFSYDRTWIMEFLGAVARDPVLRDIELTAMNGLCYSTLDEEVLSAMRRAGFRDINLSLVTRSPVLREAYRRPRPKERFEDLIRVARRLGFFITVYVIIGIPGQTFAEIKDSIDYLLGLGVLVGPSVFYPAPGSPLYEELTRGGNVRFDWNSHRSSAFAVETPGLSRKQLVDLFLYVRRKNLERKRVGRAGD